MTTADDIALRMALVRLRMRYLILQAQVTK